MEPLAISALGYIGPWLYTALHDIQPSALKH